MKAVNHSILKVVNALLVALLGLFGFTNCEPRQEYGTVEAVYAVKGKVTSRADGKPIEGIRVSKFFYTNSPI
ncbi:MAG: radical SAM-associated putative lipoprotein, partial [Paludibacter sp.]|nr:radical SAM-associated putative lipoprotein [Paludibacter sp.]